MIMNPDRRLFLRGGRPLPIRPPWALPENEFLKHCDQCGDCFTHCPQDLLEADWLGYPTMNFCTDGCTFCGACLEHCSAQALVMKDETPPWQHTAKFAESCLNSQGIACRTCGEQCDHNAITFHPTPGGHILPQLIDAQCSGCGACCAVCPVAAITFSMHL